MSLVDHFGVQPRTRTHRCRHVRRQVPEGCVVGTQGGGGEVGAQGRVGDVPGGVPGAGRVYQGGVPGGVYLAQA